MNQYSNFCQLKQPGHAFSKSKGQSFKIFAITLMSLFFHSCSLSEEMIPKGAQGIDIIPQWFQGPRRMAPLTDDGEIPTHLFFDPLPAPNFKKRHVSYVRTTPRGSDFGYKLDLRSGRLYRRFEYCPQEDVWGSGEEVYRPPMHIGHVPRLLDHSGRPQKIVVFGQNPYLKRDFLPHSPPLLRAKVVGAVVEQYCEEYPCESQSDWVSRPVLVAVDPYSDNFKDTQNLVQLKGEINWDAFKKFIENGQGRTSKGERAIPAYRMVGEVGAARALKHTFQQGLHFKFKKIKRLQSQCHNLYDKIWSKLDAIKEKMSQSKEKPIPLSTLLEGTDHSSKELFNSLRFNQFFLGFYQLYGDSYQTCSKFVRSSNVLVNAKRHWRFAFFDAFFNLQKLGFAYVCSSETWRENPLMSSGEYRYNQKEELQKCSSEELNSAFSSVITRLMGQRVSHLPHYHYILYDMERGGSHEKLYSWNYSTGKKLGCEDGQSKPPIHNFPDDVIWKTLKLNITDDKYIDVIND